VVNHGCVRRSDGDGVNVSVKSGDAGIKTHPPVGRIHENAVAHVTTEIDRAGIRGIDSDRDVIKPLYPGEAVGSRQITTKSGPAVT